MGTESSTTEGSKAFVVADAHGGHELVAGLLRDAGILDEDNERVDRETTVVQLGDLCNCVVGSIDDDIVCLERAPGWFDVLLVGNHELPYFGGGGFGGWFPDPRVRELLLGHVARGLIKPCLAVDGILVSHAGLAWSPDHAWPWATAEEAASDIEALWVADPRLPIFSRVGRSRGGFDHLGGILWSDWSEPKLTVFSQIVGHTVGTRVRVQGIAGEGRFVDGRPEGFELGEPFAVCIDLGAKTGQGRIAGVWIRDGQVDVLVHEPKLVAAA